MFTECTVGCEEAVTELLLAVYILLFTGSIARSANLPVFSLLRGQF